MELLQDPFGGYAAAFGAEDLASREMKEAIARWRRVYEGRGEGERDHCLRLAYTVVRKLSRAVFAEYRALGSLEGLPHREAMELAMVAGESYLKPILGESLRWLCVDRGNILVFGRDLLGEPTDVGLTEKRLLGRHYFTLLERRRLRDGALTVENRLFRSSNLRELGREVPLNAHPAYAELPRKVTVESPGGLGLVRMRMPMHNCVDGSREGVSVYAAAADLMDAAAENEFQMKQEFRNGASRLVVSRDMLSAGQLKDSVFVALDESPETVGITVFSPQLREQSYLNRQQAYLRSVENVLGLKRGLLSQVEAVDRTATEITNSEGEYMTAILELREAWEKTAREAVKLRAALTGEEYQDPQFRWGDGVV